MASKTDLLGLAAAVAFVGIVAAPPVVNTYRSLADRYDLVGTVAADPARSLPGTYTVILQAGSNTWSVYCNGYECGSLEVGQHVAFDCFRKWNVLHRDEEVCNIHDSMIE